MSDPTHPTTTLDVPPVVREQFDTAVREAIRLLHRVRSLCADYARLEGTVAVLAGPCPAGPPSPESEAYEERRYHLAEDTGLDMLCDAIYGMTARLLEASGGMPVPEYENLMPETLADRWGMDRSELR